MIYLHYCKTTPTPKPSLQISSNWAVSAAHCYRHGTHDTIASEIRLVLGDHDRIQDNALRFDVFV